MKFKILTILLAGSMSVQALANETPAKPFSMLDLTYENVVKQTYDAKKLKPYDFSSVHGTPEVVDDGLFAIIKTPEHTDAMLYLNDQDYLPEYRKNALKKLAFATSYMIQNSDVEDAILSFADTSNMTDVCAYYNLKEQDLFVAEKMVNKIIQNGRYKDNLVQTHALVIGHKPDFWEYASDLVPFCGQFVGSHLTN